MRLPKPYQTISIVLGVLVAVGLLYQLPAVKTRLGWRVDFALAYVRGVINPAGQLPTALPQPRIAVTLHPSPTPAALTTPVETKAADQPEPTALPPTPSPTPIPKAVSLPAPKWEKQDINNCGPTTLALYLRFYGWEGDQKAISDILKPQRDDRNVNVEELIYFVRTRAGWLNTIYRVGGNIEVLKQFLAAGIPVMVEETFYFEEDYWPNDDHWAAHYNLITGYDDATQTFTSQDSFYGPDKKVSYSKLDEYWRSFNRVYILIYPPTYEETVKSILGEDWDERVNREKALAAAQEETRQLPDEAFAWFNVGTNLVYFERYDEAAVAFDQARALGLPQRMLRYQFTPFFAYFHARRMEDLAALTEYALKITRNSEEALLWRGWELYRKGDKNGAIASFQQALVENPNYTDARLAIDIARSNP